MPTISFTVTTQEAQRIVDAVSKIKGSAATSEEARQFIIQKVKQVVLETERETYLQSHTDDPFNPT